MPSAASINRLMRPTSIAIVGASPRARMGVAIIRNARTIGLKGAVLPVNPNYREIDGLPCYPSLRQLPEIPDCVIVIVPANAVLPVIAEAGALGMRAAIVVANGFADARSEEGRERQKNLIALAKAHDMAIAGPNCLGLSSFVYRFANTYTDLPENGRPGGVSIISQSGGLLNAAAYYAADRGGGLNYLISGGNHAVMDIPDYIDFLAHDPQTKVIACIMEGVANGRRFRAAIERASPKKPIVILKLGRSETGQRATLAHTGTLAGRDDAYKALFRQNGVAQAASIDDLMETAMVMAAAKRPHGDGVVMLTISGGTTGLMADLGEAAGLRFPLLSDTTNERLRDVFGGAGKFNNPIDTAGWPQLSDEGNLDRALDALLDDDSIDLVSVVFRLTTTARDKRLLGDLARRAAQSAKPIVFASTVSYTVQPFRLAAPELAEFPIAEDLENAQRAVGRLIEYGLYRHKRGVKRRPPPQRQRQALAAALYTRATLTEFEIMAILAEFDLPVTRGALATSRDEAAQNATAIGFPVALKIQSPDVPHKTDAGGVVLNVQSPAAAREAFDRILANVGKRHPAAVIDGVLVQEMISPGVEFILGMTSDSQLGPLVVCGLGGVMVELLKDVAVRFPPFDATVAREMLGELRGAPLLSGYRGAPPCDVDALVAALVKFGDMAAQTDGRFAAIDINPLIVGARGAGVRIADAVIIPADPRSGAAAHP